MKPVSSHESYPDPNHGIYSRTVFGFWLYILTDFILFGTLFATYAVLRHSTFGGPTAKEILDLPFMFSETIVLLVCSFVAGLGGAAAHRKNTLWTIVFFAIVFLLGITFIAMEFSDFSRLIHMGSTWKRSGFLSLFFTLLGTHGLHVIFATLWVPILIVPLFKEGVTSTSLRRLICLKMFWQFLNIVWIFIFAFCLADGGIK